MPGGIITFHVRGVPNAFRHRTRLRVWLHRVARTHGRSIGEVAFVLLTDRALRSYNVRFLGRSYWTDVITFPERTGRTISGDILISYERVRENALLYGVPASQELARVMAHGILHLIGYKDDTATTAQRMRREEDLALTMLRRLHRDLSERGPKRK